MFVYIEAIIFISLPCTSSGRIATLPAGTFFKPLESGCFFIHSTTIMTCQVLTSGNLWRIIEPSNIDRGAPVQANQELPQLTEEERTRVEKIYEDYGSLMFRTACGLTGNQTDAGDLVQDCLICLMRNIATVSSLNDAQTAGYIVITLKHLHINAQKNRPEFIPLEEDPPELQELSARSQAPLDADARLDVQYVMQQLSDRDRQLLERWYLDGCSCERLAQEMNCKPGSIRALLSRVRSRAAKILKSTEKGD